ncbi:transposase [Vagococcus sp. CY53-2]|uniref:transposase n=1 Tax=Vagococcus sp. CY53-2 TaxID=2925780 RepID=UPI001F5072CA|nr:transposase [Vagococcus sp. CY53-2]MCI0129858.1 transposase [Vagococcus sp. CY53-2]
MLKKQDMSKRNQIGFYSLEDLVSQEHFLRDIDKYVDFSFIYQLVEDKYDQSNGRHGWVLGYTTHPGNQHDSRTFISIYNKLKSHFTLNKLVMDAGYKTPGIAHLLFQDNLTSIFPYKRPMTKKGFFKKYDYVYDEYYNQYICPNMKTLTYTTTNRDGYREYKSNPHDCMTCSLINKCTQSKDKRKQVQRHLWEDDMERCEDIRHSIGMKSIYNNRKQTIERLFGTGKEKMHMKIGLTFACLNIKKLAKVLKLRDLEGSIFLSIFNYLPTLIIGLSSL